MSKGFLRWFGECSYVFLEEWYECTYMVVASDVYHGSCMRSALGAIALSVLCELDVFHFSTVPGERKDVEEIQQYLQFM